MATMPPNHQKLIVTGKNKKADEYGTDMRTIEQWANEGIVRSLHAGSGITLNPSTGVDTGTGITISSSGGGLNYGTLLMNVGPEDYGIQNPLGGVYLAAADMASGGGLAYVPMVSKGTPAGTPFGTQVAAQITTSWLSYVGPGQSACLLPVLTAPTFTGATFIK